MFDKMRHITIHEDSRFLRISTDPGYWLTEWKDGDDIRDFYACQSLYCSLGFNIDTSGWRVITDGEYRKLIEKQKNYGTEI